MRWLQSTLALLMASVGADDVDDSATADHLAVFADLLDGWTDFHGCLLENGAASAVRASRPRVAPQAGLLHEALVLVGHQVRLKLRHEVHNHHHDD